MTRGNAWLRMLAYAVVQVLAWLPAALAFESFGSYGGAGRLIADLLGAALAGTLLSVKDKVPPRLAAVLLLAATAGTAVALGVHWILPSLYWGVVAWSGFRRYHPLAPSLIGLATNGVLLIAATWVPEFDSYRGLFIVSGIVWLVAATYVGHAGNLDSAGLHNGIVTRLVSRSSRRYLAVLLAVVIIVYAATSDFHLWRIIREFLAGLIPKGSSLSPEPTPGLPEPQSPLFPPAEEAHHPAKWLDYGMYGLLILIVIAILWFLARRFLLNRAWFAEVAAKLRQLLQRLMQRRAPEPAASYTDEKESLLDIGKALRQVQNRWLRRHANKPIAREEWERLGSREKVRRLYQDSVLQAIGAGYKPKRSDTPTETLEAAEQWYESRFPGREGGIGGWLRKTRALLADLYGRVRYGSDDASQAELNRLAEEYPWDSRRAKH